MDRRALLLIGVLALVLQVRSDNVLKCYACTSINETCEDPQAHKLEPIECTMNNVLQWQNKIKQHNVLKTLLPAFEVDSSQFHNAKPNEMACAKMSFKLDHRNVTVRSCQAKKDSNDPCKMQGKLPTGAELEYCDLCEAEACNGSYTLAPDFLGVAISLLTALVLAASRRGA